MIKVAPILTLTSTLLCAFLLACGGDDTEAAAGAPSVEERIAILEARIDAFQEYIVTQTQKEQEEKETEAELAGQTVVGAPGPVVPATPAQAQPNSSPSTPQQPQFYVTEPVYTLTKENASENEQRIVAQMADCSKRKYLNENLSEDIIKWEVEKEEEMMWEALASGQFVSFDQFVGMAFQFCND